MSTSSTATTATTRFGFACRLRVDGERAGSSGQRHPEMEALLDGIMEELCRLGVIDPWIGATLSTGQVDVSLQLDAPGVEEAFVQAMGTIRAAIHAAGAGTPDWPHVERIELEEAGVAAPV